MQLDQATWIFQILSSPSSPLSTSAKSLRPGEVTQPQARGIRMWTSLGNRYSARHRALGKGAMAHSACKRITLSASVKVVEGSQWGQGGQKKKQGTGKEAKAKTQGK